MYLCTWSSVTQVTKRVGRNLFGVHHGGPGSYGSERGLFSVHTEDRVYYRGNGSLLWCSIVVRSTYHERSTLLPKHCLIVPNQDDSYSACVNYYCSETGGSVVRLGESGYNENDNFHFLVVYGVSPDEKP